MSFDPGMERMRSRIHGRAYAYRAVFMQATPAAEDRPRWWQRDFWRVPSGGALGPAADVVLRDLARYCYADKPTLKISQVTQQSDALAMAFAEGRRDVFNRIKALCNLNADQIDRIVQRTNDHD